MSDLLFLKQAQAGDALAFERLVTPCEKMVWQVCYRILQNRADAEDAAQETFLRAWRSISQWRGDSSVSTWLYKIAITASIDYSRKRKARGSLITESLDLPSVPSIPSDDVYSMPEQAFVHHENLQRLRKALLDLPEEQKIPLILYSLEEKRYEDIAEILSLPIGTIKSRIARARIRLAEQMKDPDDSRHLEAL